MARTKAERLWVFLEEDGSDGSDRYYKLVAAGGRPTITNDAEYPYYWHAEGTYGVTGFCAEEFEKYCGRLDRGEVRELRPVLEAKSKAGAQEAA